MRQHLESLVEELKRLKQSGISTVSICDSTMDGLRKAVAGLSGDVESSSEKIPEAPAPVAEVDVHSRFHSRIKTVEEVTSIFQKVSESTKEEAVEKIRATPAASGDLFPKKVVLPEGSKQAQWDYLKDLVLKCDICNKHKKEDGKVVFGVGDIDADVFFCGEAPGEEEEKRGEPFVGAAGELLDRIIQAMGLSREKVYIANIMNWRPETGKSYGNRPPTAEEMAFCLPYLRAQVEVVKPKLIVALGATAAKGLLGADAEPSMGKVRGKWQLFGETPVMPTYHPSYLLRSDSMRTKRMVWEDMLQVMEKIDLPVSEKQQNYFKE
ncbi:MAG: uracil-DNA glycosylase [Opitutaceae bacterium]|nr:uracil-DNA glycosylase [Opitutaceae bacterium]